MLTTLWAEVKNGKIEPVENVEIPEGTKVLITVLSEDETKFWLKSSESSLDAVWNNSEDDIYEQLLKK